MSHLLAYSNNPDRHALAAMIAAGTIGTVREVHNWTNRPFWPQGMQAYHETGEPVPDGFNWPLWQGPEPDRYDQYEPSTSVGFVPLEGGGAVVLGGGY